MSEMLSPTRQLKDEIEMEESSLPLSVSEIKKEADEEVTVDTTVQDHIMLLSGDTVKLDETSLLTPKCEPKCEGGLDSSVVSSGPDKSSGRKDIRGKCPVCSKHFVCDRMGFQEISRHIFNSHRKTFSQSMLVLRMKYCSSKTYHMIKRKLQSSCNISEYEGASDRVLRSQKSRLTVPPATGKAKKLLEKLSESK